MSLPKGSCFNLPANSEYFIVRTCIRQSQRIVVIFDESIDTWMKHETADPRPDGAVSLERFVACGPIVDGLCGDGSGRQDQDHGSCGLRDAHHQVLPSPVTCQPPSQPRPTETLNQVSCVYSGQDGWCGRDVGREHPSHYAVSTCQLVRASLLHQSAGFESDHEIGCGHHLWTMRDDQHRDDTAQFLQCTEDRILTFPFESAGRLIQNQKLRTGDQCPRKVD